MDLLDKLFSLLEDKSAVHIGRGIWRWFGKEGRFVTIDGHRIFIARDCSVIGGHPRQNAGLVASCNTKGFMEPEVSDLSDEELADTKKKIDDVKSDLEDVKNGKGSEDGASRISGLIGLIADTLDAVEIAAKSVQALESDVNIEITKRRDSLPDFLKVKKREESVDESLFGKTASMYSLDAVAIRRMSISELDEIMAGVEEETRAIDTGMYPAPISVKVVMLPGRKGLLNPSSRLLPISQLSRFGKLRKKEHKRKDRKSSLLRFKGVQ